MEDFVVLLSIVSFITSAVCSLLVIPMILRICRKKKLYDKPNARKIHRKAIPRLGGAAFIPCIMLALLPAYAYAKTCGLDMPCAKPSGLLIAVGAGITYGAGLYDDIRGITPLQKLVTQAAAAMTIPLSGLCLDCPFTSGIYAAQTANVAFTLFIIIYISNTINLIDGIDGLCGCIAMIVLMVFFCFFATRGTALYSLITAGTAGCVAVFLFFNLAGNADKGSKIFMGDTGSLTLGFIICVMGIKLALAEKDSLYTHGKDLLMALTAIAIPVMDLFRVALFRLRHHRNIFAADKSHIHHRMMDAGMSQHMALAVIISATLILMMTNSLLADMAGMPIMIATDITVFSCGNLVLGRIIRKKGTGNNEAKA